MSIITIVEDVSKALSNSFICVMYFYCQRPKRVERTCSSEEAVNGNIQINTGLDLLSMYCQYFFPIVNFLDNFTMIEITNRINSCIAVGCIT